jgi:FMN reductase
MNSHLMTVSIVVGNPKRNSRTLLVARTLIEKMLAPGSYRLNVVDLAEFASQIFEWPSETMKVLTQTVAASDLVVVASPTYKATYTGLLKSFLDRYPHNGLRGVTAIAVMTGADQRHAMAPDMHLRPLMVELGAVLPTKSLFFMATQMDRMDQVIEEWVDDNLAVSQYRREYIKGMVWQMARRSPSSPLPERRVDFDDLPPTSAEEIDLEAPLATQPQVPTRVVRS